MKKFRVWLATQFRYWAQKLDPDAPRHEVFVKVTSRVEEDSISQVMDELAFHAKKVNDQVRVTFTN